MYTVHYSHVSEHGQCGNASRCVKMTYTCQSQNGHGEGRHPSQPQGRTDSSDSHGREAGVDGHHVALARAGPEAQVYWLLAVMKTLQPCRRLSGSRRKRLTPRVPTQLPRSESPPKYITGQEGANTHRVGYNIVSTVEAFCLCFMGRFTSGRGHCHCCCRGLGCIPPRSGLPTLGLWC